MQRQCVSVVCPNPIWYLLLLGVDDPYRGQGLGGRLIEPVLARARQERLACYLETEKEENLGFYARHGFHLAEEGREPRHGVRTWGLLRPAHIQREGMYAWRKQEAAEGERINGRTRRGRYVGHPRAFGFLLLEGGGADLFVPPKHEGDAIDGDTVLAERRGESAAKVTAVVERGRSRLSGTYIGRGAFLPDAHRIPKILSVEGKARKGDKVLVAVRPDALRIRRVLGRAGDPAVEDAAVLAELEISPQFPKPVLAQAAKLEEPGPADFRGRLDLRDTKTVVTIDPVSSRDYDDAISLERRGKGWLLGVHIADVSHYVRHGSALDKEARERGTSVYLPTRVIPMLPEKLSNDLCSLREGVDRLTMSVLIHYDARGELLDTTFARSVIRSDRRLSYERASRVMDKTVKEKGGVGELLLNMARLAKS